MDETLTLMRLGITGQLAKTPCSTNPCESMIEIVRHAQRNVKRWQDGDMRKRWTAAGMLVAEQQFRRIIGYRDLAKLVIAIERHAARTALRNPDLCHPHPGIRSRYCLTVNHPETAAKFHDDPGILDAEPAKLAADSSGVSHSIRGPADITVVLELFDRRYRDVRGEDDAYSSEDPDYPHGRIDQL